MTYTGREFDPESGFYFYRARYYDPGTGRFLSQDPIGFRAGDVNTYRYVLNSPINFRDPLGLEAIVFGDQADGTPLNVSAEELRFAIIGTLAPAVAFVAGAPCVAGALYGGVAAAASTLAKLYGSGIAEQVERNNRPDSGCAVGDQGPILQSDQVLKDLAFSIADAAAIGCAAGYFGNPNGSVVGLGATTGVVLGLARGYFGEPPADPPPGF